MYIVTIQKHHRLQYLLDDSKKDIQIILLECEAETLGPAAKEASPFTLTFMPLSHNYKLSKSIRCMTYLSEASKWSSRMSGVSFRHSLSCTWRESLPGRALASTLEMLPAIHVSLSIRRMCAQDWTRRPDNFRTLVALQIDLYRQTIRLDTLCICHWYRAEACKHAAMPSCSQLARCSQGVQVPT